MFASSLPLECWVTNSVNGVSDLYLIQGTGVVALLPAAVTGLDARRCTTRATLSDLQVRPQMNKADGVSHWLIGRVPLHQASAALTNPQLRDLLRALILRRVA